MTLQLNTTKQQRRAAEKQVRVFYPVIPLWLVFFYLGGLVGMAWIVYPFSVGVILVFLVRSRKQ